MVSPLTDWSCARLRNLRGPLRIAPNRDDRRAPFGIPRAFSGHSGRPAAIVSCSRRCLARSVTLAIQAEAVESTLLSNWNGTWPLMNSIPDLYQGDPRILWRKAHRMGAFQICCFSLVAHPMSLLANRIIRSGLNTVDDWKILHYLGFLSLCRQTSCPKSPKRSQS